MEYLIIIAVVILLFLGFVSKEYFSQKKKFEKILAKAEADFGCTNVYDPLTFDDFSNIKVMFERFKTEYDVDDITASDLEIDKIFEKYNVAHSAPGREYFYKALRSPVEDVNELKKLDNKVEFIRNHPEVRPTLYKLFVKIGFLNKTNFFKCLDFFDEVPTKSIIREIIADVLLIAAIVAVCIFPQTFIFPLIIIIIFNIVTYYSKRGEIEPFIICLQYICNFIKQAEDVTNLNIEPLEEECLECKELLKKLSGLRKNTSMLAGGVSAGAGNPLEILADYFRMVFHLDIIMFYRFLSKLTSEKNEIEKLYCLLGKMEYFLILASMRESLDTFCKPEFSTGINCDNVYHPLIKNPVKNSLKADRGILITGSNASGKSTFLKTIAINVIFAKTIYTCTADSFSCDDYTVFSSMSLKDDLMNEDSYFMVEIKALKRILDFAILHKDTKVLCFVDEVLRGTNTIERIAACTKILENIIKDGIVCFAATHDIELTDTLSKWYDNYHFEETIENGDISFSYEIKDGRATSRNAIKLLSIMGYSDEIVSSAQEMAENFINKNVWRN